MKQRLMSILRDRSSDVATFREAADKLAFILAAESASYLETETVALQTPIAQAQGVRFKNNIALIPILRSGLVLLPAFLHYFEHAGVGFVGLARDEETALPFLYYKKLPTIGKDDQVFVLDPMIATGGSGSVALKILIEAGVREEQIIFIGVIAAPEGIEKIKQDFPHITLTCAVVDEALSKEKFIVPGLGDFGDRYFRTEETM